MPRLRSLLILLIPAFLCAGAAFADPPMMTGTKTKGGLSPNSQIIHVTNLDDNGRGSLRAAIDTAGARVIVFDVGGRIDLRSDLIVHKPYVTIAGQTAPSPGISIWGASLRIRTHDVVVQHFAVRAGPGATKKINDNRDAISIDGNPKAPQYLSYDVRLENVSAMWSVDEALSTFYKTTRNVTIRASIVAEALRNAGHPKGQHSMGLLVGEDTGSTEVTGNLLASNSFRNPVVAKGAVAYVANNYVVNPGQNAMHTYGYGYGKGPWAPTYASFINNAVEAGRDTKPTIVGLLIQPEKDGSTPNDVIYQKGNDLELPPQNRGIYTADGLELSRTPVTASSWKLLPTDQVKKWVLDHAGPRPANRDPVDQRLINQILNGTERIIDRPEQAGPIPDIQPTHAVANVPADPLQVVASIGKTRLEMWLCLLHLQLGGAQSVDCPETPDVLSKALAH
jgi:pectate lyase